MEAGPFLVEKLFARWRSTSHRPGFGFLFLFALWNFYFRCRFRRKPGLRGLRFYRTNRLSFEIPSTTSTGPAIHSVFVSTKKDFEVLPSAIHALLGNASFNRIEKVDVIVPSADLVEATELLKKFGSIVSVIDESNLLPKELVERVRRIFGIRSGWVIQQFLKVESVKRSKSNGVLIVDSDTLLIEPRLWLRNTGQQLLTPTWEYHRPYYEFLNAFDLCETEPRFTFVSHHMLMQPRILNDALEFMGWTSAEKILTSIEKYADLELDSPFCIEYELYSQYISKFHPDLVMLEKWANMDSSLPENFSPEDILKIAENHKGRHASLSFHSYLRVSDVKS